jgi:hypothetical protein
MINLGDLNGDGFNGNEFFGFDVVFDLDLRPEFQTVLT